MRPMAAPLRIANCSGFYGDRLDAAREMVFGGPIDVLTGDYLAELTMAILAGQRRDDPDLGFVPTFLEQLEHVLERCVTDGIKIVSNAGGLNPPGLAAGVRDLARRLGLEVGIGVVAGDDVFAETRAGGLPLRHAVSGRTPADEGVELIAANAYLGGWGITEALDRGADVVVTGRVSDASLVVGPAAHHHGWSRSDWDALAGAVVAGHVIECGPQATGGNFSFFDELPGLERPGFPIAEVEADGSCIITKHPGTGGAVTVDTVVSQLLYEIGGPRYLNPDVTARFDTIAVAGEAADRVRISGAKGEPPPRTTKVVGAGRAGFRNSMTFLIAGLDVEAKARLAEEGLRAAVGDDYEEIEFRLLRTDHADPSSNEAALAHLVVTVSDPDAEKVGRAFSGAVVSLALGSYPGFSVSAPPRGARPLLRYWPSTIEQRWSQVTVGGESREVPPTAGDGATDEAVAVELPLSARWQGAPTVRVPIGRVLGARSGDKGGDANLGVFARTEECFDWMAEFLSAARLRELIPEARDLDVERHLLPNLRAANFVLRGLLGEGASSSTRWDPQAKTLGEYFRSRVVAVPEALLAS
jgi:hypothetical protein